MQLKKYFWGLEIKFSGRTLTLLVWRPGLHPQPCPKMGEKKFSYGLLNLGMQNPRADCISMYVHMQCAYVYTHMCACNVYMRMCRERAVRTPRDLGDWQVWNLQGSAEGWRSREVWMETGPKRVGDRVPSPSRDPNLCSRPWPDWRSPCASWRQLLYSIPTDLHINLI